MSDAAPVQIDPPAHPGTVERTLAVLWDASDDEVIVAVDHRFPALAVAATAVATTRGTDVTAVCASGRDGADPAPTEAASGPRAVPLAWADRAPVTVSDDAVIVRADLGDGGTEALACGWRLTTDGPPISVGDSWPAPGLGLRRATGTIVAVTGHDTIGHAPPRHGLVRHDVGVAHLRALAELGAPPAVLPAVAAARLAVRADDGTVATWPLHDDEVFDAVRFAPGTRWPTAVRTSDGIERTVTCRVPMRALGPTDGWWDPERWHDELAVGIRRLDAAAAADDVRHLHTLAVVRGEDGSAGTLDLLVLGTFEQHGFAGFTGGWLPPAAATGR